MNSTAKKPDNSIPQKPLQQMKQYHVVQSFGRPLYKYLQYLAYRHRHKIFAIGLSRTGTTSLTEALRHLGYRAKHFPGAMFKLENGRLYCNPYEVANIDAITDTPVARFYKQLDEKYPNAKYILTIRDVDKWLKSCGNYFSHRRFSPKTDRLHLDLYCTKEFDRDKFKKAYDRHTDGIISYFQNRADDLLILNICANEGWEKLCRFLRKQIPVEAFPRANVSPKNNHFP